jgi:hypothetical protein
MTDRFFIALFGGIDRIMDRMFGVDYCGCGHRAHCDKRCADCRCEHCNCVKDKKKFRKRFEKQLAELKKRDPFTHDD